MDYCAGYHSGEFELLQPLTDKKNLSIHCKPVLIQEVVEEAHRVENTIYSATVKLKWGLQVVK